jgi:predicted  nucleic acid-binding Zn-ribbon protein
VKGAHLVREECQRRILDNEDRYNEELLNKDKEIQFLKAWGSDIQEESNNCKEDLERTKANMGANEMDRETKVNSYKGEVVECKERITALEKEVADRGNECRNKDSHIKEKSNQISTLMGSIDSMQKEDGQAQTV